MQSNNKFKYVLRELAQHLPYSIFGVSLGMVVMGVLTFFAILMQAQQLLPKASGELFHVFHSSHVLFSAVATTAMFWKHERNLLKAVLVGFLGSIIICGISDAVFPFMGGLMLGTIMEFHICIFNHPGVVFPFAIVGVIAGIFAAESFENSTEYSHLAHVFLSSMASILYLMTFGFGDWIQIIGAVFIILIVAVIIPCCASDIVFPLTCTHKHCEHD